MSTSDSETETPTIPAQLAEDTDALSYKYRDFANVPEELESETDTRRSNRSSLESSIRVQKFPVKLYAILGQKEFADIITWMPHGRSWKVLKPNLFESLIMPLYFEYSNYHSFNRLVNAWSFRRVSSGADRGSYYHELFLRGKPHLQKYMRRLPKTHKKLPMKKQDEPDFYELAKTSPLPEVAEVPPAAAGMLAMRRAGPPPSLQINPPVNQLTSSYPGLFNKPTTKDPITAMDPLGATLGQPPPPGATLGQAPPPLGMGPASFHHAMHAPQPKYPPQPLDMPTSAESAHLYQLQRMRHLQHLQMFQQQLGSISSISQEDAARQAAEANAALGYYPPAPPKR